ncbi:MAG: Long-chain-fatty-acid--CoA ligase FadD15 [Alphaproteobacteria bacterium MarineAlpha3_Bin5]|nr:long-chain fatty acid--CoA ligase [Magnetovibrio sp.]PPR80092.1 MAG: Long-chain-fatty-acid--CoA ligase FadD15 [Alphaproteobacteria bacterium MarineAlpha3_Bin5]
MTLIQEKKAETWDNLPQMFFDQASRFTDRPFLWKKHEGLYVPISWHETKERVLSLSRGLIYQGVAPGDRVILASENRPAWMISELAILSIGAIAVPTYTTNTEDDYRHILHNSGAKGGIVSTTNLYKKLVPPASEAPDFRFLICMEAPEPQFISDVQVISQNNVLESGAKIDKDILSITNQWQRIDTACIIYTSGTGGAPKGVVLSHGAILHNCAGARDALEELGLGHEIFLSFLPLSHSYEHMAGQFFPISIGAEVYYAEGIETLSKNMLEARPTIMTAVPRLYESMHQRITNGLDKAGVLKKALFFKTLKLGNKKQKLGKLGFMDCATNFLLDRLVRNSVRKRFGGRLKALVSGGAPLNPEIGFFFTSLGLRILQGYGQTESAPLISVNRPNKIKMNTVGPPVLATEVRIADDGEILVRGELVMQGYWRNQAATSEVLVNGWLHTGDVGHLDEDGYLVITDRKKDIIVNSGGDNIAPQKIEGFLCLQPEIDQAMVYGDKHPHLVSVIVPNESWLAGWVENNQKNGCLTDLVDDPDFYKALNAVVDRVNAKLSNIEKIRRFVIAKEAFTINNKLMTPTMKVRRHMVVKHYGEKLERLYNKPTKGHKRNKKEG